jgi:glucosylceramidase
MAKAVRTSPMIVRLMLAALLFAVVVGTASGSGQVNPQTVEVWLTAEKGDVKLRRMTPVGFTTPAQIRKTLPGVPSRPSRVLGGLPAETIIVDETQTYQQIEGFGASFTDSAAFLLNEKISPSQLSLVMTKLFDRTNGIGISFVRNPMGASDLSRNIYSYDDLPAGQTDTTLANFSIAHDLTDIVPLVRLAKQINPQLKIMANPWSPPGWMKTSGSMIGGSLMPNMYPSFANYFVKYVQAYETQGIPIDYISLQNEPLFVPTDYPGLSMDGPTQVIVLRDFLLPALVANNLNTKVLIYDHNWDRPDYADAVFSDPALLNSPVVAGIAWHGYAGTPGVMMTAQNKYPGKGNYETEHSGGTWISNQIKQDFEEITQVMRNWGKTYVKWSLALDQNRGPHTGGCGTCSPLVTIDQTSGAVSYAADYYTLGHFSKFVVPGAYRIYSNNAPGLVSVAFKNPDGSKVLVVYNEDRSSKMIQVLWGTRQYSYQMPAASAATFTWDGDQDQDPSFKATGQQIQASSFNDTLGLQTETTTDLGGGYDVGYADDGDWACYKNIDFGSGVTSVTVRVASAGSGGTLEFHRNGPNGPKIGSVTIPITGGWQNWTTISAPISGVSGVNDLYLVFRGTTGIGNLNWFRFGQ